MFDNWLDRITTWLREAFEAIIDALWEMLQDFLIVGLDMLLTALEFVLQYIPVPDFIAQYSVCSLLATAGPTVQWIVGTFRIGEGLALIGGGYAFRLVRKFATGFQW